MSAIMICSTEELRAGFNDSIVDPAYQWGDPRRYSPLAARLQRIESAARAVLERGDIIVSEYRREFSPGELPDVDELDKALEALRKALDK